MNVGGCRSELQHRLGRQNISESWRLWRIIWTFSTAECRSAESKFEATILHCYILAASPLVRPFIAHTHTHTHTECHHEPPPLDRPRYCRGFLCATFLSRVSFSNCGARCAGRQCPPECVLQCCDLSVFREPSAPFAHRQGSNHSLLYNHRDLC